MEIDITQLRLSRLHMRQNSTRLLKKRQLQLVTINIIIIIIISCQTNGGCDEGRGLNDAHQLYAFIQRVANETRKYRVVHEMSYH